jgi:hypothetical protein
MRSKDDMESKWEEKVGAYCKTPFQYSPGKI